MRRLFASASVLTVCMSSLFALGCETSECTTEEGKDAVCAESLEAFESDAVLDEVDYVAGGSLTIQGKYGDIAVLEGDAGVVKTTFQPFNYRGHEHKDEALLEIEENLQLDMSADADGNINITTDRTDSVTGGLGSHITVYLPPEFDGVLIVENEGDGTINQGNISVESVGQAQVLNVVNHGLENCNILRPEGKDDEAVPPSTLLDTDVRCEADITVRAVNDNVVVHSRHPSFHSNVRVEIASISADATGGEITGDNSSIEVQMPTVGDYVISASAAGEGAHIGRVVAGDCETTSSDETNLELSCGAGGPVYTVSASDSDDLNDDTAFVNVLVDQ